MLKYFCLGSLSSALWLGGSWVFSPGIGVPAFVFLVMVWMASAPILFITNFGQGRSHRERTHRGTSYEVEDVPACPKLGGFAAGIFIAPLAIVAVVICIYVLF